MKLRLPSVIATMTVATLAVGAGTAVADSTSTTSSQIQAAQTAVTSAQTALTQATTALNQAQTALSAAATSAAQPVATSTPTSSPSTPTAQDTPAGNWAIKFDDEFSGTSVDTTKWGTRYPWGTQLNTGTSETQCYLPSALSEGSGVLTITATRQQATCQGNGQVTEPYVSGMIQSAPSYTFTYGYSEIRAKLPGATTTWPAFWQLPADYSWPPEFDVFEGWGQHDTSGNLNRITQTDIWAAGGGQTQTQVTGKDFTSTWHTYGVDWEPGSLTFYLDGVATAHYSSNVPSKPMYLLANLAMQNGSASSGPSSAKMLIDYIRVYQKA